MLVDEAITVLVEHLLKASSAMLAAVARAAEVRRSRVLQRCKRQTNPQIWPRRTRDPPLPPPLLPRHDPRDRPTRPSRTTSRDGLLWKVKVKKENTGLVGG